MVNYDKSLFIRKGWGSKAIHTGILGEASVQGRVINIVDMTMWDANDGHLGYLINTVDWDVAVGGVIAISSKVWYIDLNEAEAAGCEVVVTEGGTNDINAGIHATITTDGAVIPFVFDKDTEAGNYLWVVGVAMAKISKSGNGFIKLRAR